MSSANATAFAFSGENRRARVIAELATLGLGAAFTTGLLLAVAHFDGPATAPAEPELAPLRVLSVPPEMPPPRPVETPPVRATAAPLTGLEIAASESPVRIAVLPPDLSKLVPVERIEPAARIEPAHLYSEFKPHTEIDSDFSRIYQVDQVDQRPLALVRPNPSIPPWIHQGVDKLRVFVVVLIDAKGAVSNVRILESSGNEHFDGIIVRDIRERWVFSPAVKNGRKVRCLVQQNVRVEWTGGSPFETR